jgi:hypothetical protein
MEHPSMEGKSVSEEINRFSRDAPCGELLFLSQPAPTREIENNKIQSGPATCSDEHCHA